MNRAAMGVFIVLTVFMSVCAAADNCVKTGTVCVESGGTRLVDGIPVTRDCWATRDTYACLQEDNSVNGCASFEAAPETAACVKKESVCTSQVTDADTGVVTCLTEDETWQCADEVTLPSVNAEWISHGLAQVETESAPRCAAYEADATCTRTQRTCSGTSCTVQYACEAVTASACTELAAAGCSVVSSPACDAGDTACTLKTGVMTCEGTLPEIQSVTVTADKVTTATTPSLLTTGCAAASNASCTLVSSVCTEAGGIRRINGRVYMQPCWAKENTYSCTVASTSTCGALTAAGCTELSSTCTDTAADGTCRTTNKTYRCSGSPEALGEAEFLSDDKIPEGTITVSECASLVGDAACTLTQTECLTKNSAGECTQTRYAYACQTDSSGTMDDCAAMASDASCRETESVCLGTDAAGNCTMRTKIYVCEKPSEDAALGEVCGQSLCLGGVCREGVDGEASEDFLESAAVLEITRQAAAYSEIGDGKLFGGSASGCCVKAAGFSCCRSENAASTAGLSNSLFAVALTTGAEVAWEGIKYVGSPYVYDILSAGGDATSSLLTRLYGEAGNGVYTPSVSAYGVTASVSGGSLTLSFSPGSLLVSLAAQMAADYFSCTAEDQMHALRASQNLCHYVGSWCSKKGGAACLEKRESWCCFNSRLALIVQTEGRKQLGLGWGTPEAPACRGFTLEEFQKLDFSKMDLTPIVAEMAREAGKTVDAMAVSGRAQARVTATAAAPQNQYAQFETFTGKCAAGAMGSGCASSVVLTGGEP